MPDLLTTRQLMDLLQLDRTTIYRMVNDGRLPALRVGGQWRFSRQAIDSLIETNPATAENAARDAEPTDSGAGTMSTDVLPLHCLQPIQEVFAQTAGIGTVTTDVSGTPLLDFSNPCAFCSLILATQEGRERCRASWQRLADRTDVEPRLEKCHAGLTYARGWIQVGGQPVAMIFGGQFVVGRWRVADSSESLRRIADECALDAAPLAKAARDVRILSRERAEHLLHLLQMVAETFSTIGQERLDMMRRLERVAQIASGASD